MKKSLSENIISNLKEAENKNETLDWFQQKYAVMYRVYTSVQWAIEEAQEYRYPAKELEKIYKQERECEKAMQSLIKLATEKYGIDDGEIYTVKNEYLDSSLAIPDRFKGPDFYMYDLKYNESDIPQ